MTRQRRLRHGSRRASNKSDYLLAGLISCTHFGARFVGGAANGSKYRYRYYTYFSRHRYGARECAADRLPADELEAVVLARLAGTYARDDVLARALSRGRSRAAEGQQQLRDEPAVTEADLAKAEEAIERYLLAFENGSMPEATCSQRVQALAEKAAELREHRADLMPFRGMAASGSTQSGGRRRYSLLADSERASHGRIRRGRTSASKGCTRTGAIVCTENGERDGEDNQPEQRGLQAVCFGRALGDLQNGDNQTDGPVDRREDGQECRKL